MKRITSFTLVATVFGLALTSCGADPKPREFGPEWTKVGDLHVKKVEVVWTNNGGNFSQCELKLSQDTLQVSESDGSTGYEVRVSGCGEWDVQKDAQGKAKEFRVVLKDCVYFDIDGDGMIDGFYDRRTNKLMIVLDGRHVPVENSKTPFMALKGETPKAWGVGRKERYEFDEGKWTSIPVPAAR